MADRLTYPDKDSNSQDNQIKKFFDTEANEIKAVTDNHADEIESIQSQLNQAANPAYGTFTSLTALQLAHPTGELNAWAVIDAGVGVTPQIAVWDNTESEWQLVSTPINNIVYVNNVASLPPTGVANTWYITTDSYSVYVYNNNQYQQTSIFQSQQFNQFSIKAIQQSYGSDVASNGQVLIEYTDTSVTKIYFPANFSNYISKFDQLTTGEVREIELYNLTSRKLHKAAITNITSYQVASIDYYIISVANSIPVADMTAFDKLVLYLQNYNQGSTVDGNTSYFSRANTTEDVAPTSGEVPNPVNGDAAEINLNNEIIEVWVYVSSAWVKRFSFSIASETIPKLNQITGINIELDENSADMSGNINLDLGAFYSCKIHIDSADVTLVDTTGRPALNNSFERRFDLSTQNGTEAINLPGDWVQIGPDLDLTTTNCIVVKYSNYAVTGMVVQWYRLVESTTEGGYVYGGEISSNITLNTTHKGKKWFRVTTDAEIIVPQNIFTIEDLPVFKCNLKGTKFISGSGFRLRGVRTINNEYIVNDNNSTVGLIDLGSTEGVITGNLTRGYSGAVTTSNYTQLRQGDTATNVTVTGTGFSSNMLVTVSANATLNSFTVVSPNEVTLNLDAVGSSGDTVTVTYDNGDVFVDTDAITIASAIIVYQDNFNDNTINTEIWDITNVTDALVQEQNSQLELSATVATAPTFFGLVLANAVTTTNDIIIIQFKPNWGDTGSLITRFGLTTSTYNEDKIAVFTRHTASAYNRLRALVIDNAVTEVSANTTLATNVDTRIKYVPSTGAVTFEYWNGSAWTELSGTAGNVDLGTSVKAFLYTRTGAVTSEIASCDDFYICNDDYSTQYP